MVTNQTTLSAANDIRDIKPPLEIPNPWIWVWVALAIVVALVILFFILRWWKKRKLNKPLPPPIPAHVRAKQKLQDALALISQPKEFCILVSDTIRFYLEERFEFRAPERTTEEFLHELKKTDLLFPDQKESLGQFLESCDLVKFAKYEPGENELHGLHGSAFRLVEETEPQTISNPQSEISNEKGSVPAPGAVRRTLAPNTNATEATNQNQLLPQDAEREARSAAPEAGALPESNRES